VPARKCQSFRARASNFLSRGTGLAFTRSGDFGYALHRRAEERPPLDSEQEPKVMETELREAMTSGVFVEFCDERGNCVAQSVYLDWRDRPLPGVGDRMTCGVTNANTGRSTRLSGRVRCRHFDVQRDAAGTVSVWVRVVVDLVDHSQRVRSAAARYPNLMFSDN
jgi:hypothetical protein